MISAGNPEDYFHPGFNSDDLYPECAAGIPLGAPISKYILTESLDIDGELVELVAEETGQDVYEDIRSKFQIRDWSDYINTNQQGKKATVLTMEMITNWSNKYMGTTDYTQIYSEQYAKYQNIIDNYAMYFLGNGTSNSR